MRRGRANLEELYVDPRMISAVNDLVTDAHCALAERAASSWPAEQREAIEDTLERVRALMRELAQLAGYEDGTDATKLELPDRRPKPLVGMGAQHELLPGVPDAGRQSR